MKNKRSLNYKKQLKFSFIYKILAIVAQFLIIRYTLEYLGVETYGIWSVILIFINWLIFFDFGIANGVKNQVAKSLSQNKIKDSKSFISTGYIVIFFLSTVIYMLLFISSYFINWQTVFNTEIYSIEYLQNVVLIISFFILINFVLSTANGIFNATQNASLIVLNQFLTQIFSLTIIFILSIYTTKNLIYLSIAYGVSLVLSNLILSFYFYSKIKYLIPRFSFYDKKKIKSILSLGFKFFIIQITVLIIMSSDRMITIQLLDSTNVTNYDLIYKYFSILLIVSSLISTPLWSMYTEAYKKKDYNWIKKTLRNLNLLLVGYLVLAFIMVLIGDKFILIWTGNKDIEIPLSNYIFMSSLILTMIWSTIYAYFLNGIEELNIQLITTSIGAIINIPLSIYFVKYLDLGLDGIILASITSMLIFNISGTIQTYRIIKKWEDY